MITEHDLLEAIAECQGQRNPNANTCIKLASLYTILDHIKKEDDSMKVQMVDVSPRSFAAGPGKVDYNGKSEFSRVVNGKDSEFAWGIMDELMATLEEMIPRLYAGVMNRLKERD